MNTQEITEFKKEFKSIVWQHSELVTNALWIKKLNAWDRNDSHKKAILKKLDERDELKKKIATMLKGKDYEWWKIMSKRIGKLESKLKTLNTRLSVTITSIQNTTKELNNLTF